MSCDTASPALNLGYLVQKFRPTFLVHNILHLLAPMAKTDKKTKEKKVQKATVAKAARSVNPVPVTSKEILAKARTELPVSNSAV